MKVSLNWLREWIETPLAGAQLAERLTLAGLEVGAVEPVHPGFKGALVVEVRKLAPHPDADKLRVCEVATGHGATLSIVCGAPNVREGMKAVLLPVGGSLPDGTVIRRAKLRGVESEGMLCSAKELGLSADASGLMELPADAPVGTTLDSYLALDDEVLDIELTPNRGDCLGMLGVARDLGAILDCDLRETAVAPVSQQIEPAVTTRLQAPEACARFLTRVIRGVNAAASTPVWMRERLRRAGIRPVSVLVDVTQYVMLETGQPMHAYDLAKLEGELVVRWAQADEHVTLLDGRNLALEPDMLVVADQQRALGLAGIMGGQASGVQPATRDVLLESAWFAPDAINGRGRRLALQTDASYRFERGVDPAGQQRTMERATALIVDLCGGQPGSVAEAVSTQHLPKREPITLRREKLDALLGIEIPAEDVTRILTRLGMAPRSVKEGWQVQAPSHRFDIAIEADLIEEVGRIHGYDRIPVKHYAAPQAMHGGHEGRRGLSALRTRLVERGYQEIISYSFVAPSLQQALSGGQPGLALANPISAELSEMRSSLLPGLLTTLQYNLNRQQNRVKLFELGLIFTLQDNEIKQENHIAGLRFGNRDPEQWGTSAEPVDFADIKSDVEALLEPGGCAIRFEPVPHAALHPGQSASIHLDGQCRGWIGALHPRIADNLALPGPPYVFELEVEPILAAKIPHFEPISRYPVIRRDLSVVIPDDVAAAELMRCARSGAPGLIHEVIIFDIYRGEGIDSGRKSVALGLILQDSSRTLTDEAADAAMARITARLVAELGAKTRD